MSRNWLELNADKTRSIWIGTWQQLAKVNIRDLHLLSATVHVTDTVSGFGVVIDSQFTMKGQVAALCLSCFYQLHTG